MLVLVICLKTRLWKGTYRKFSECNGKMITNKLDMVVVIFRDSSGNGKTNFMESDL